MIWMGLKRWLVMMGCAAESQRRVDNCRQIVNYNHVESQGEEKCSEAFLPVPVATRHDNAPNASHTLRDAETWAATRERRAAEAGVPLANTVRPLLAL